MRLIIVVEGQTEEAFVRHVLKPHLEPLGVYASATIVGKMIARKRGHQERGGGDFRHWQSDITDLLANDKSAQLRVTTLFDLYGLPKDFPELAQHINAIDSNTSCDALTGVLAEVFNDHRFIPYLQRHEFEALVLASLDALSELLDAEDDLEGLKLLREDISGTPPEDVNEHRETAPSKRLMARIPGYSKTLHGPLVTGVTGIEVLCERCPRFGAWIKQLEALSSITTP